MSINYNQYIIAGVKLPYTDDEFYEKYESFQDNGYDNKIKNGLTMLHDGLSGEYIVIGEILAKAPIGEPFEDSVMEIYPLTEVHKIYIQGQLKKCFNIEGHAIKILIVTHWH